jgi:hypothetical protein
MNCFDEDTYLKKLDLLKNNGLNVDNQYLLNNIDDQQLLNTINDEYSLNSTLDEIKQHIELYSSELINNIIKQYYIRYKHVPNDNDVLQALYNHVIRKMGIEAPSSSNLQTIEEVIDDYMVYGGEKFIKNFIYSFDNDYSNQTLNHALLNYMCNCDLY